MIQEFLIREFSKRTIDFISKSLKNTNVKSYSKEKDVIDSLRQHLVFVKNWSSELDFHDLKKAKSTKKVFVNLELYYQPIRVRISDNEQIEKFELKKIFDID